MSGDTQWENPFLDDFEQILAQILDTRQMPFAQFRPILIDSDEREQSIMTEEDTVRLLAQLGAELNSLEILTERPEYFKRFSEKMFEEYGLPVQVFPRNYEGKLNGNVVLDLERHSPFDPDRWKHYGLYISFYKRKWREIPDEQGNLDIAVPIGYNIVTVKTRVND